MTNAFTGLSGSDFGRKELDKPPSSTGIDFKPTKKISLPRDNQTGFSALSAPHKKEAPPTTASSNDGWGDGASGFNFEEYAATTNTTSSYAGGLPAPARSGLAKPPTSSSRPVARAAPPQPSRADPAR